MTIAMVTNQTDNPNRQSQEGSKNPMWGKHHSQVTKDKISKSQKKRYNLIRKQLKTESTEDSDNRINLLNLYIKQGRLNTMSELKDAIYSLFQEQRIKSIIEQTVSNYISKLQ